MSQSSGAPQIRGFFADDSDAVWRMIEKDLKPAKPYERAIINKLLSIESGGDNWALQRGIKCGQCGREVTILDYFLTGVVHHPMQFMERSVNWESPTPGSEQVKRVLVMDRDTPITCLNCGNTIQTKAYVLYVHPGDGGKCIRMSSEYASNVKEKLAAVAGR